MRKFTTLFLAVGVLAVFVSAKMAVQGEFSHQAGAAALAVAADVGQPQAEDARADARLPVKLRGLEGQDVQAMLMEPELVRADAPVVVWQYRNGECVLDVFFSVDAGQDPLSAEVVHYEMRARQTDVSDEAVQGGCLADLIMDRGAVQLALDF